MYVIYVRGGPGFIGSLHDSAATEAGTTTLEFLKKKHPTVE
jgi:hypothetical protein